MASSVFSGLQRLPPLVLVVFPVLRVLRVLLVLAPSTGCAGGPLSEAVAADQVTSELCAHAVRCDDVGAGGRTFASLATCLAEQATAARAQWGAPGTCTTVETPALDGCLLTIRTSSCAGPSDLGEVWLGACAASKICPPASAQ